MRAAGFRALAKLGYRPIGMVTDPSGSTGVGFRADVADGTEIVAFDPATGRGLGSGSVLRADPLTPGDRHPLVTYSNGDITGPPA